MSRILNRRIGIGGGNLPKPHLLSDEYTDDELNQQLLKQSRNRWEVAVGHSPTKTIGKKPKYENANYIP